MQFHSVREGMLFFRSLHYNKTKFKEHLSRCISGYAPSLHGTKNISLRNNLQVIVYIFAFSVQKLLQRNLDALLGARIPIIHSRRKLAGLMFDSFHPKTATYSTV